MNELLVHHGRRGRKVVRLKGGDPFIFGRGFEEVEALVAAGIEYEVVPGVSTFTAVPGLAGIPLTTRGVAAQLTVLTGTSATAAISTTITSPRHPARSSIFMGLRRLEHLADNLILSGRQVDEPAAVVSRLSLPDAQTRVGTLGTIAAVARGLKTPSLVIVGDVVASAEHLRAAIDVASRRAAVARGNLDFV